MLERMVLQRNSMVVSIVVPCEVFEAFIVQQKDPSADFGVFSVLQRVLIV